MNKRQAKKARNKMVYPFADEMNLLTLNQEEYQQAMKEYDDYAWKYGRYKHYKDKKWKARSMGEYYFPIGQATKNAMKKTLEMVSCFPTRTITVTQSLDQLKQAYPTEYSETIKKE